MEEIQNQSFAYGEILNALDGVGPEAQAIVLGSLEQQLVARRAAAAEQRFRQTLVGFASTYERVVDDGENLRNAESWYERLQSDAEDVLAEMVGHVTKLSPAEVAVRDAAAITFAYLTLEDPTDNEPFPDDYLAFHVGVDTDAMLAVFKEALIVTLVERGEDETKIRVEVNEQYRALKDFRGHDYPPIFWKHTVQAAGTRMKAALSAISGDHTHPETL